MEKINKITDLSYSKLATIIGAIFGFLFITIINNKYSIDLFNSFSFQKQFIIFIVSFSDIISLPILSIINNKVNVLFIFIFKFFLSVFFFLFFVESDFSMFMILVIINLLYNSTNIFLIQKNFYKHNFIIHFISYFITIFYLIFFIDTQVLPIIYFFLSNSIVIILSIPFILKNSSSFKNYSFNQLLNKIKSNSNQLMILGLSIFFQPVLYNFFILKIKEIYFNDLYFIEYYLLLSSLFTSVILISNINLMFTQKIKPSLSKMIFYFFAYTVTALFFLSFLHIINGNEINYLKNEVVFFFIVDFLKIFVVYISFTYIINNKFHISVITEIIGLSVSYFLFIYFNELYMIILPTLISLVLLYFYTNAKEENSNRLA